MKKVFLAAVCAAMVMVSCKNKQDEAINKFESAVNEYVKALEAGDLAAAQALLPKFEEIGAELKDTTKLSDAQKARLREIGMKMANASMATLNEGVEALDNAMDEANEVLEGAEAEAAEVLEEAAAE